MKSFLIALLLVAAGVQATQGQSAAMPPAIPPGPSMQDTEAWIKRELKAVGSGQIRRMGEGSVEKVSIEDAALSECKLTVRLVVWPELNRGGQVLIPRKNTYNVTLLMNDLVRVESGVWYSKQPGFGPTYFVDTNATPVRDGFAGIPVRDKEAADQIAAVFRRAAILCGAHLQPEEGAAAEGRHIASKERGGTSASTA